MKITILTGFTFIIPIVVFIGLIMAVILFNKNTKKIPTNKIMKKYLKSNFKKAKKNNNLSLDIYLKPKPINITDTENLSPYEFEEWISNLFRLCGFDSKTTKKSHDFGADILLSKDGVNYVCQCKHLSNSVGLSSVQEIYSAKKYYDADKAMVISSSYNFTKSAIELANKLDVQLFSRNDIVNMINHINFSEIYIVYCPNCLKKATVKANNVGTHIYTCKKCTNTLKLNFKRRD